MLRPHSPIGLQRGKNPTQNMNHIFPPVFQEKFLFSSLFWYKVVKCSFVRKFYLKISLVSWEDRTVNLVKQIQGGYTNFQNKFD